MLVINAYVGHSWVLLRKAHEFLEMYSETPKNKTPVKKPGFVISLNPVSRAFPTFLSW